MSWDSPLALLCVNIINISHFLTKTRTMCNSVSTKPALSFGLGSPVKVKTIFEKPDKQVDISNLNSSKVASLKAEDPFAYFSIPAVRRASMMNQDLDMSAFDMQADSSENPSKMQKVEYSVTRQTRVSCEAYPNLDLQDFTSHNDEDLHLRAYISMLKKTQN